MCCTEKCRTPERNQAFAAHRVSPTLPTTPRPSALPVDSMTLRALLQGWEEVQGKQRHTKKGWSLERDTHNLLSAACTQSFVCIPLKRCMTVGFGRVGCVMRSCVLRLHVTSADASSHSSKPNSHANNTWSNTWSVKHSTLTGQSAGRSWCAGAAWPWQHRLQCPEWPGS